jgi:hypothetical protein
VQGTTIEGKPVGQSIIQSELTEFSGPTVGRWFRAKNTGPQGPTPDQFVQVIDLEQVVRRDFEPERGEAWERLTDVDAPVHMRRMLACDPLWQGGHLAIAYEYLIWDDDRHPCRWLSEVLTSRVESTFSLTSFLALATSLWKVVGYLHRHGLHHYNIRPSSILCVREAPEAYRFYLFNTGLAFAPEAIPAEEHEYYEEKGPPHQRFRVFEDAYDAYDEGSDDFGVVRVLQRVFACVAPPTREMSELMREVDLQLHTLPEKQRRSILANINDLQRGSKGVLADCERRRGQDDAARSALEMFGSIEHARVALCDQLRDQDLPDDLVKHLLGSAGIPAPPPTGEPEFHGLTVEGDLEEGRRPFAPRIQALDRGEGEESTEPCGAEMTGTRLHVAAELYLVPTAWTTRSRTRKTKSGPTGPSSGCAGSRTGTRPRRPCSVRFRRSSRAPTVCSTRTPTAAASTTPASGWRSRSPRGRRTSATWCRRSSRTRRGPRSSSSAASACIGSATSS